MDYKTLYNLYINEQKSTYAIGEILNLDPKTIRYWLIKFKLPIRKKKIVKITKRKLSQLYLLNRKSIKQIADLYKCSAAGILKILRRHNIDTRNTSEAGTKNYRRNFAGGRGFMAYLIGFRIGDFHVQYNGWSIRVSCGTTKKEQVNLINSLFRSFSSVYIGNQDKRGAWHVECRLNKSFHFLIKKHSKIPKWIMRSKSYFLKFLAGYTDAEGSIGIYGGGARFKILSYDKGVLLDIKRGLKKFFEISCLFYIEPKNAKRRMNQDAYRLQIGRKKDLVVIFRALRRLLRHDKRKNDLKVAYHRVINYGYNVI